MKSLDGERARRTRHTGSAQDEQCSMPGVLVLSGGTRPSSWIGDALSLDGCAVQWLPAAPPSEATLAQLDVEVIVFELFEADLLLTWCEFLRDQPSRPAVLVVSSQCEFQVRAFQAGADDCISEEHDAAFMTERVLMNARRLRSVRASNSSRRVLRTPAGTLAVLLGPLVALDGVPLDLPRVQIRLLRMLMEASHPVSVGELASGVWPGELVAVHTVHTQIALLRSRLECLGIRVDHIRRSGYVLSSLQRKEA